MTVHYCVTQYGMRKIAAVRHSHYSASTHCRFTYQIIAIIITGFSLNFENEIPRLCSTLFSDPFIYFFDQLVLPYIDFFLSSFLITCTECVFSVFLNKNNNGHANRTMSIIFPDHRQNSLTFPHQANSLTLQVSVNPVLLLLLLLLEQF